MKNTPITDRHIALGAKMTEFAGYNMPVYYTSIQEEHHQVRDNVGMFDVSHMGEFIVKGKEALQLVQKVTSNNAASLEIGQAQYSCLPNHNGGIVDDLLVYRLDEDLCSDGEMAFMLVVNAANLEKDWNWISEQNTFDTRLINISYKCGLLAIQGPNAVKMLQTLTDIDLESIPFYHFTKGSFAGLDNILISATGYTGSGGFELYASDDQLPLLWDSIMEAGKSHDIKPVGLGARDTLRLEMGYCLYGNDIDDETSPLEAGLSWITKLKKGPFNSSDIFIKQKAEGVTKKLIGFSVDDRRVPRKGYGILNEQGENIGIVTSGTQSPSLGNPIGMGYVKKEFAATGNMVQIDTGRKLLKAEIEKTPFYKKSSSE